MAKQKKRLVAHENLIFDVICRQAGTLSKAILEGVMNSIDAGATRIDIQLHAGAVSIADDGMGFRTEQEIDDWFAMFGTPHEVDEDDNSVDARYGRFRMGRGQLFAFGRNRWVTNQFVMDVDVKANGLDFEVEEHPEIQHKGCAVQVHLYEVLDASTQQYTERDVRKFCKYVDVDLFLNGERINVDPRTQKWDHETEDGWIKVVTSGEGGVNAWRSGKGVDVYQQGVYVETIPEYDVGVGGTIVTKAPLKLNFARNQVMRSSCPRWKRMYKLLKGISQEANKLKKNLDPNERSAMIDQILSGEMKYRDAATMRLFPDVQNKTWSANQLKAAASKNSKFELTPTRQVPISFGRMLDPKADKIMQRNAAVVLSNDVLEQWETTPEKFIEDVLDKFVRTHGRLTYVPLDTLDATESDQYRLLHDRELTPREHIILEVLGRLNWSICWQFRDLNEDREARVIRAGQASHARAWTDGMSYIAIDIEQIRSRAKAMNWTKWSELVWLMLHEYCHAEPDMCSHTHDAHFYQLFHEVSRKIGYLTDTAHRSYMLALQNQMKKVPQNIQAQALKEAQVIQQGLAMDLHHAEKELAAT